MGNKVKAFFKNFFIENITRIKKVDFGKYFTNPKYLIILAASLIALVFISLNIGIFRFLGGILGLGAFFFVFLWKKD